jgi:GH24 family phage-related lysozyme (muramidase)
MAYDNIRQFEGFRSTPYWDVNAWRVGYGSDTITRADGTVVPVQQGMTVSREDAERDFNRRIEHEFVPRVVQQIGSDAWQRMNTQQREALASIAYNYGSIPQSVVTAARSGDPQVIGQAIQGLGGHNDGVNRNRRNQEAQAFLGGQQVAAAFDGDKSNPSAGGKGPDSKSRPLLDTIRAVINPFDGERPIIDALKGLFDRDDEPAPPMLDRKFKGPTGSQPMAVSSATLSDNWERSGKSPPMLSGPTAGPMLGREQGDLPTYIKNLMGGSAGPLAAPQTAGVAAPVRQQQSAAPLPIPRPDTLNAPPPIPAPGRAMAPPPLSKPPPYNSGGQAYVDQMAAQANRHDPRLQCVMDSQAQQEQRNEAYYQSLRELLNNGRLPGRHGSGNDRLPFKGGSGNDRLPISGGSGNDRIPLKGGSGIDSIPMIGGSGTDRIASPSSPPPYLKPARPQAQGGQSGLPAYIAAMAAQANKPSMPSYGGPDSLAMNLMPHLYATKPTGSLSGVSPPMFGAPPTKGNPGSSGNQPPAYNPFANEQLFNPSQSAPAAPYNPFANEQLFNPPPMLPPAMAQKKSTGSASKPTGSSSKPSGGLSGLEAYLAMMGF